MIFGILVLFFVGSANPIFAGEFGLGCPDDCNNQGECISELCVCNIGFSGTACEVVDFPSDGSIVGGELVPTNTTSLLLAGTFSFAAWMIPVIVSAIGIGIVLARKV